MYSEDGESNGTALIGEKQPQIFIIEPPDDVTIKLDVPVKTLMNLGVSKDRICKEFGISYKTLSNILSGQQVSHLLMEHYVRLLRSICYEKKLSLDDFNSSSLESGSVTDELKALIAQGGRFLKLRMSLGKVRGKYIDGWRGLSVRGRFDGK